MQLDQDRDQACEDEEVREDALQLDEDARHAAVLAPEQHVGAEAEVLDLGILEQHLADAQHLLGQAMAEAGIARHRHAHAQVVVGVVRAYRRG